MESDLDTNAAESASARPLKYHIADGGVGRGGKVVCCTVNKGMGV